MDQEFAGTAERGANSPRFYCLCLYEHDTVLVCDDGCCAMNASNSNTHSKTTEDSKTTLDTAFSLVPWLLFIPTASTVLKYKRNPAFSCHMSTLTAPLLHQVVGRAPWYLSYSSLQLQVSKQVTREIVGKRSLHMSGSDSVEKRISHRFIIVLLRHVGDL